MTQTKQPPENPGRFILLVMAPPSQELEPPTSLGRFRVVREDGEQSMASFLEKTTSD